MSQDDGKLATWILTGCLFAAGVLFAAFAGWAMTDKLADRELQINQVQADENLHGECKSAVDQLVLNNARTAALLAKCEQLARRMNYEH